MGVPVKHALPTVTGCPLCGKGSLRVYADPRGGAWYSCRACGFNGDSIQIYARSMKIEARDTIRKLVSLNMFTQNVDVEIINRYARILARRQAVAKFWKGCQDALRHKKPEPRYLEMLQRLRLGLDWSPQWYETLGAYIGGANKQKINKAIGHLVMNSNAVLALPYHDVPGRPSFVLYTTGRQSESQFLEDTATGAREGGLFMLDSTTPGLPAVYAVGDPLTAIYLQRKQLLDSDRPLPVVAWNDDTCDAWNAVRAKRVILWDKKVDYRLFDQARRAGGMIATEPQLGSRTPYEYVREQFGIGSILSEMERSARPWLVALKEWMLSHSFVDVAEMLTRLSLTKSEKRELLYFCDDDERLRIGDFIDNPKISNSILYDSYVVTERGHEWYFRPRRGGAEKRLSNVIIRITKALRHEAENKNYYSGVVECEGRTIPFTDPVEDVVNHTFTWLSNILMANNLKPPDISKTWVNRLVGVAQEFEQPKVMSMAERVGFEGDDFAFPMFSISKGVFHPRPDVAFAGAVPAMDIEIPRRIDPENMHRAVDLVPGNSEFWALFACIVANTMGERLHGYKDCGAARRCIGLIGKPMEIVSHAIESAYALTRVELKRRDWRKYLTETPAHDLPTVVAHRSTGSAYRRLATWLEDGHRNIITPMSAPMAFSVSITDEWVFAVARDDIEGVPTEALVRKLLPFYIARLQTRDYELPDESNVWRAILEDLRRWIFDVYTEVGDPELTFEKAKTIVRAGSPDGEKHAAKRLLDVVIYMAQTRDLGVNYEGFQKTDDVSIDSDNKVVRIDMTRVNKALSRLSLPEVDWDVVIQDFKDIEARPKVENQLGHPAILYVSKDEFDRRCSRFQKSLLSTY